ncbi:MAG TPA: MarR family transcriptional regulator [Candidatus Limnocylindrales bacterium]|jgi:DNA-binding MarR family transcriptional regulator
MTLVARADRAGEDEGVLAALERFTFATVGVTERAMAAASSIAEVSLPQWRVLTLLYQSQTPLRLADLGSQAGLSASSASRMMDRLADRGLIGASIDRHDRRVLRISLTRRGRRLVQVVLDARRAAFREAVRGLGHASTFAADLVAVADALAELPGAGPSRPESAAVAKRRTTPVRRPVLGPAPTPSADPNA